MAKKHSGRGGKNKAKNQVHKQRKTIEKDTKLSSSQEFLSADQMDEEKVGSNVYELPGKRDKKKDKSQRQIINNDPKLSKSQKRKLRKLEEDKEKDLLMAKSMETLEKYKLPDNVYSLMLSSGNIGQCESVRERRRRDVQFLKMGLSVPQTERHRKAGGSHEVEHNSARSQTRHNISIFESDTADETVTELPASAESTDRFVCNYDMSREVDESATTVPAEEIPLETSPIHMQELNQGDMPKLAKSGTKEAEDLVDGSQNRRTSSTCNLEKVQVQKVPIAPVFVHVSRPEEVNKTRKDLPIVMMEQEIMEAINENNAVIICGETGCGKTTQVPQFLYEAGFGSDKSSVRSGIIGVTQPRRVAVLATAKRVSFELGLRLGKEVGFQVRHDRRVGNSCSIKFMTDGILLREVQNEFLLKKYSVLILDEAHERSLNTDILIGMLSRVIKERQRIYEEQQREVLSGKFISSERRVFPLKLILMSATLRVDDFVSGGRIFRAPPPVIEVPTRQYPVTVHFSKRTEIVDYIGQAYKKVLSIHKRLPPGGILVFVTGQREVEYLCKKLRKASKDLVEKNSRANKRATEVVPTASSGNNVDDSDMKEMSEAFDMQGYTRHDQTDRFSSYDEDNDEADEDDSDASGDSETDSDLDGVDEDRDDALSHKLEVEGTPLGNGGKDVNLASLKAAFEALAGKTNLKTDASEKQVISSPEEGSSQLGKDGSNVLSPGAMCVLPLYAMLPASAQLRVFDEIKEGERLIVVATNVAETSLTIPGIKYVVDTGREKVKQYNSTNGMESYEVQWISKASAAQRAGRAGRTAPGHCYRLYSSAAFSNTLPDFSLAEISKTPVDGVVLLLKSIGIDKVINFPFPTPPEVASLVEAERCLKHLEALNEKDGTLTPLGRAMVRYPMSPRHSRMLLTVIGIMRKVKNYERANLVLGYTIAVAAALSLQNPFIVQFEGQNADEDSVTAHSKKRTDEEKSKKKQLKESIRLARASFSNPTSDALTIAYALQCFELAKSPAEFCSKNALHMKTMEEMSKLRKQLLQLVFNQGFCGIEQEFSWTHGKIEDIENAWRISSNKNPLLLNEEELLGQAICAGWADRVARRMRGVPTSEEDRKVSATRYQACMVKESIFLHRRSSVSKTAPDFLVYDELVHSRRPYIHGATSVKSDWLVKYARSQCTFSAVEDPKPYYDPLSDRVFSWVLPSFGPHLWQLPLHSIEEDDADKRVAVFACSLLEGHVLPCLKSVGKFLAASPGSILKPEASGLKRVGNLLNKMKKRSRSIDTCAKLGEAWDENPRELYEEIRGWFQAGFTDHFDELWSEMHREVRLEPKERYPKRFKSAQKGNIGI